MTADQPVITDAVLDQWERSAQEDVDADRPWSVNPKALLVALAELRAARAAAPASAAASPSPARFLLEGAAVLAAIQGLHREAGRMSRVSPVDVGVVLVAIHQLSDEALTEAIERRHQANGS